MPNQPRHILPIGFLLMDQNDVELLFTLESRAFLFPCLKFGVSQTEVLLSYLFWSCHWCSCAMYGVGSDSGCLSEIHFEYRHHVTWPLAEIQKVRRKWANLSPASVSDKGLCIIFNTKSLFQRTISSVPTKEKVRLLIK